jgi:hypothetical protein
MGSDEQNENQWRRDFEGWGYEAVKRTVFGGCGWDEPRRQFAFRWLHEKENEAEQRERDNESATEQREQQMLQDNRRMFWVAIAALVISAFSLIISLLK